MRVSQAKELFRALTQEYFAGAWVTFSRQSRVAKPNVPLVSITPGNVNRPQNPSYENVGGEMLGYYPSRISMTVDLFTPGREVVDEEMGGTVAHENTAVDDMLAFADFLNSEHTINWCHENDVAIQFEGDVQDLTGLVNDTNYEFRSRLVVLLYFTQKVVGHAAVATEDSIQPAGGHPPSPGGDGGEDQPGQDAPKPGDDIVIEPHYEQTSSGGGTEELATQTTGYFTEVEIKEDKV